MVTTKSEKEKAKETKTEPEWKLYKRRWLMLAIFFCFSVGNVFQWIQYSIIANIVQKYYNVESLAINWTSMIFMIIFIPFIFPASRLMDKVGMRWPMLIGTALTALGACIKLGSVRPDLFWVTFLGQTLVAIGQVFLLSVPPVLAAIWFGQKEISTACAIGTIGNLLGIVLGFLLPPLLVRNSDNIDEIGDDLMTVFIGSAAFNTAVFVFTLAFFQARPPTPPSPQQAKIKEKAAENEEGIWKILWRLMHDKNYMLLLFAYSFNQAVLNALSTLLNQLILTYFENEQEFAGYIGVTFVASGVAGGFFFGLILDLTRAYKFVTLLMYALSFGGMIAFTFCLSLKSQLVMYILSAVFGFFLEGYMPIAYDFAAEITYPEPEATTSGLLTLAIQIISTIVTYAYGEMVPSIGPEWSNHSLSVLLLIGTILHVIMNPRLKRQEAKHKTNPVDVIPAP